MVQLAALSIGYVVAIGLFKSFVPCTGQSIHDNTLNLLNALSWIRFGDLLELTRLNIQIVCAVGFGIASFLEELNTYTDDYNAPFTRQAVFCVYLASKPKRLQISATTRDFQYFVRNGHIYTSPILTNSSHIRIEGRVLEREPN